MIFKGKKIGRINFKNTCNNKKNKQQTTQSSNIKQLYKNLALRKYENKLISNAHSRFKLDPIHWNMAATKSEF